MNSSIERANPQAVVPRLMKFGGVLHDASGKPLTGTVDVTFALYNTEAGGTPLWFETQSVQADDLGRYTALLGAMHTDGLPVDLFTSGEVRWLGIQVGLEAEQPRVLLVSVPYALKAGDAETLGGKPASAYMLSEAQSGTATGTTATSNASSAQTGTGDSTQKSRTANATPLTPVCASVTSNTGGTANYLAMFDATCDVAKSNIIQAGSNVGIGTATPGSILHLVGNNSTLTISGTGTHQVNIVGATSGRLGQDAVGFFFSSDTNGASIRFATNNGSGHEWMRITSAGGVGIGTTTPVTNLHVKGPGFLMARFENNATGTDHTALFDMLNGDGWLWREGVGGIGNGLGVNSGQFYIEQAGFGAKMVIDTSGDVGMGTPFPYTALHVRHDASGSLGATLTLMNGGGGAGSAAAVDFDGYDPGGNPPAARIQSIDDGNASANLTFSTKSPGPQSNPLVEQVRISDYGSLIVDSSHNNAGSLSSGSLAGTGLVFGGAGSGEGIASDRGTSLGQQYSLGFYTGGSQRMVIYNGGEVQMNVGLNVSQAGLGYGFTVNGNGQFTGCLVVSGSSSGTCVSDARLKTNVQPFPKVLDKLVQLQPVHYTYRAQEFPEYQLPTGQMTGLIAQQTEKFFPEMVSTDANGFKRVNYSQLPYLMLEGVRELKAENDRLKSEVNKERNLAGKEQAEIQKLTRQVQELKQEETEIAALKARLDRLEAGESTTRTARGSHSPQGKQSDKTEVARARF